MMDRPETCCDPGEYKCTVPMPINGRVRGIDFCIADIVAALNAGGVTTVASCCGHGEKDGVISLEDGRELVVRSEEMNDKEKERSIYREVVHRYGYFNREDD